LLLYRIKPWGEVMICILIIGKGSFENYIEMIMTARAFGASSLILTDKRNERLARYAKGLCNKWGGVFDVYFTNDWRRVLKEKRNYKSVYLTRFGMPINSKLSMIKTYKNLIVIVTMNETYKPIFERSDFNVSITPQPHTNASAIATFLYTFYTGRELALRFKNAKLKVAPSEHSIHIERTVSR